MRKKKLFGFSMLASVSLLAFGVAGCSSNANNGVPVVRLNKSSLEMQITDDPIKLSLSASKGYSGTVRWFSSNETVAYVSNGYVYPVGVGTATITAAYAGGFADCVVTVTEGGDVSTKPRLVISPTSKSCKPGDTFNITVSAVYPEDTTVSYTSSNSAKVTVTDAGFVTAVEEGRATITATGSNGKVATCNVEVSSSGGTSDMRDIAVDKNLQYTTALRIGAPKDQVSWMEERLAEFNTLTNSSIAFNVVEFEESNGTSGYDSASALPAVWPYASDQTADFHEIKALKEASAADAKWIRTNMGDNAFKASRLGSNTVGFPFTSDNGSVMFYDSSVVSYEDIDTLPELAAKAAELGREVDINYGNAFYAAGILQTFTNGESLYSLTPTDTSYTSEGHFSDAPNDVGLKGAKLLKSFINDTATYRNDVKVPSKVNKKTVLATIVDVSKVANFKAQMGSKYATGALPFIDSEKTIRLGSYLGYKFYGVNKSLSASDQKAATDVAKFLCSEYVQAKRFDSFQAKPSLTCLSDYASGESHIQSLNEQADDTILLSAIGSEFFSAIGAFYSAIKNLPAEPTDAQYMEQLQILDLGVTK